MVSQFELAPMALKRVSKGNDVLAQHVDLFTEAESLGITKSNDLYRAIVESRTNAESPLKKHSHMDVLDALNAIALISMDLSEIKSIVNQMIETTSAEEELAWEERSAGKARIKPAQDARKAKLKPVQDAKKARKLAELMKPVFDARELVREDEEIEINKTELITDSERIEADEVLGLFTTPLEIQQLDSQERLYVLFDLPFKKAPQGEVTITSKFRTKTVPQQSGSIFSHREKVAFDDDMIIEAYLPWSSQQVLNNCEIEVTLESEYESVTQVLSCNSIKKSTPVVDKRTAKNRLSQVAA